MGGCVGAQIKYPNNKNASQRPNITTTEHKHFFIMHLINDIRPKIFAILRIGGKLQYKIIVIVSLFMKLIFRLNCSQNAGNSVSKP
jgi:hypothetical protein